MANHQEGPENVVANRSGDRIDEAGRHDQHLQVHIGKEDNRQFTQQTHEQIKTRDNAMNQTINGGPMLMDGDKVVAQPGKPNSAETSTATRNEMVTERNKTTADITSIGGAASAEAAKHHQETLAANVASGLARGDATFGTAALSSSQQQSMSKETLGDTSDSSVQGQNMQAMAAAAGIDKGTYKNADELRAAIKEKEQTQKNTGKPGG